MLRQYTLCTLGVLSSVASPAMAIARQRRPVGPLFTEALLMLIVPMVILSYLTYRYWLLWQQTTAAITASSAPSCLKGDDT